MKNIKSVNSNTKNLSTMQKAFFICGIISSLLYISVDITASVHWNEFYNYTSQGFSELLAFEAPTRPFVLSFNILYNALVIVFGSCMFITSEKKLSLRITGLLLIGYAIIGIVTPTFFPAPMRNVEATATNAMHLPLTVFEVLFILLSIVFGAIANGKKFRLYSICSLVLVTIFGIWGGTFVSKVAGNQPTPRLGVIERVNIYGYLIWVIVLAVALLRKGKNQMKERQ